MGSPSPLPGGLVKEKPVATIDGAIKIPRSSYFYASASQRVKSAEVDSIVFDGPGLDPVPKLNKAHVAWLWSIRLGNCHAKMRK